MPVAQREFTIGLMVTAPLEDKFNKTGHMREACKAASLLKREGVDVVVLVGLACQMGLIPMRALVRSKGKFFVVSGHVEDKNAFGELREYIAAAKGRTVKVDVAMMLRSAMLVLEEVAGHSTFLEHYILDYKGNLMFDSHDGHGNPALADPEHGVQIVPTTYYKGVNGFGASFNYSYRPGELTLFSIGNIGEGKFRFIVSEGGNVEMAGIEWVSV